MQISQIIGGYTLGGADMLRRAMGKKKADRDGQAPRDHRRRCQGQGLRPGAWPSSSST